MADQSAILAALRADASLSSLSDADAAAALNVPVWIDVRVADLATIVDTLGIRPYLVAAQANADPVVAGSAVTAVGVISAPYEFVTLSQPEILAKFQGVLTTLVNAGVGLTADHENAILALGQSYRCGAPDVTAGQVAAARAALVMQQAADDLRRDWSGVYNRGITLIDAGQTSGTLPSLQALRGA